MALLGRSRAPNKTRRRWAIYGAPYGTSGNLAATITLGYNPEAIGPGAGQANLVETTTLSFSPEGIGPGTAGMPAVVSVVLGNSAVLQLSSPNAALVANVTITLNRGAITISLPSNQPGYQYVHDTPSTALPNGYRQYIGVGVPSPNLGNNGDLYRRADGVIGTNSLYARASGAWSAIN